MYASRKSNQGTFTCNGVAPLGDQIQYEPKFNVGDIFLFWAKFLGFIALIGLLAMMILSHG